MATETEKKRRPKARHRDVVMGCIEERITMMCTLENETHVERLTVLMDELRRALSGNGAKEEE